MANFIQVSKVRNTLRGNGFQIKAEALDTIDELIGRMIGGLIESTKSESIKSIGTDDVHRLFTTKSKKKVDVLADESKPTGCQRCGGIANKYVQHGRNIQQLVEDEAVKLYNRSQ